MIALIVIISIAIVLGAAVEVVRSARLRRLSSRICTGRLWRRQFPEVTKQTIRDYLDILMNAFLLSQRRRLAFAPSVRILDIYHAVTPDQVDNYELETLADGLRQRFAFDLFENWSEDLTLGEAFALCLREQTSRT